MATFTKYYAFVAQLAEKQHNLGADFEIDLAKRSWSEITGVFRKLLSRR